MTLLHIHVARTHGAPLTSHESITAVAGSGLEGDRNFGTVRQVTVVCSGELDEAAAELGIAEIPPGATRRNLTIAAAALPRTHRSRISIGEVHFEVRRDCAPCEVMESSVAPGAKQALRLRAGVSAHVLNDGVLRVGDPVVLDGSA